MNRLRRILACITLGVLVLGLGACGAGSGATGKSTSNAAKASASADAKAGWPKTFRLGVFGGDDAEATLTSTEPLKDLLQAKLGIPVEIFTGTSYGAVIEAMRAGRVDAMTVGPFAYILAVQEAKAEALAVSVSTNANPPVYDPSIAPYYISVIITKKGSGIATLNDLKGKGFSFVDPASASGHLAPKTLLIKNGINPDTDMKTVFAGSHPTSVLSVWNGKTPAGATYEGNLANLAKSGQVKWCAYPDGQINKVRTAAELQADYAACPDGDLVVIAQSDPIPNTPFAVRSELPPSFKAAVRDALLSTSSNSDYIAARKSWFVDPTQSMGLKSLDQMYNPLRDIAKLLNLDLKQLAESGG